MPESLVKNEKVFVQEIERIQKALKGTYTKEQIALLSKKIGRYKTKHLQQTVEHLIMTKTFLPPIGDIEAGCRVESYGDELKEDREEKEFARNFFDGKTQPKGQMAREAMKLILGILTIDHEGFFNKPKKEMTKDQLYNEMLEIDNVYPGIGWKKEAELMVKQPNRRG
ncbi:MAG: hypothetical protein KKB31_05945 [Nanoarchaeota archaeon]|nr:hypothetical protein [Nanoarchaeota archaeon]